MKHLTILQHCQRWHDCMPLASAKYAITFFGEKQQKLKREIKELKREHIETNSLDKELRLITFVKRQLLNRL